MDFNIFHKRLDRLSDKLSKQFLPTIPIYNTLDFPEDPVECQLIIGSDGSINWYSSGSWHSAIGNVMVGSSPQDAVEGQIAIGNIDNSLGWFINGQWLGLIGSLASGNPPQDSLEGQVVIGGTDNLCWYSNGNWYST